MSTQQVETPYTFELLDRPGKHWSPERRRFLVQELRDCAARCLNPVPEYQCLSFAPDALDDKLLVIARANSPSRIVAFVSCIFLSMPPLQGSENITVFHTGLTCIAPEAQKTGLTARLFARVFVHMNDLYPDGFWMTTRSAIPSSLVYISSYSIQIIPYPHTPAPSPIHLHIAHMIQDLREYLYISPDAVFDPETFVIKGCNAPGSCFRKDSSNEKYQYDGQKEVSAFYQKLLGNDEGNEVLQVGYFSWEKAVDEWLKTRKAKKQPETTSKPKL